VACIDNVIDLTSRKGKNGIEPDQALVSAVVDLLSSNANLARAIKELSARFIAIDSIIASDVLKGRYRRHIDSVAEQDRQRLHAGMVEVLDAILEYTKGVQRRVRAPDDCPGPVRKTPVTARPEMRRRFGHRDVRCC
jgi:hypothetical protein